MARTAHDPQIWFGGEDPVVRKAIGWPLNDYMQLFAPGARWETAERGVDVLSVSTQFVIGASDDDLDAIVRWAKRHDVKLSLSALMLEGSDRCGLRIEGYAGPRAMKTVVDRLAAHGGVLSYVAMDEPLLYGHFVDRPNACRDSIESVAEQVARKVAVIRSVFPLAKIGDEESIGARPEWHWATMMQDWFAAYRRATGENLAFIHADVNWTSPHWQSDLKDLRRLTTATGVELGIFYNGDPHDDPSGREWADKAISRFKYIEGTLGIVPEQAFIATWVRAPGNYLPESEPGTLTNVLLEYEKWRQARTQAAR